MKEIIKIESFKITNFKTLDSNENTIFKDSFSVVYNEMSLSAGKKAPVNTVQGCGATHFNIVAGCGCP